MNGVKLIQILLVALLCYGQIVSQVHVIGHFQSHESRSHADQSAHHSAHSDCIKGFSSYAACEYTREVARTELARNAGLTLAAAQHAGIAPHSHPEQTDHPEQSETDCTIFHAFLNLSGVFCLPLHQLVGHLHHSAEPAFSPSTIKDNALDNQRIRAPPALS